MPLSRSVCFLSLLAACIADGPGSLRGSGPSSSVTAAPTETSASEQEPVVGCSCSVGGTCECSHSAGNASKTAEDEETEESVLSRTKELIAWWQAQNETTRLTTQSWSGSMAEQTVELWAAAAGRRGAVVAGGGRRGVVVAGGGRRGVVVAGGGARGVACGRRGGCGCVGGVGCGCAARRGCVVR